MDMRKLWKPIHNVLAVVIISAFDFELGFSFPTLIGGKQLCIAVKTKQSDDGLTGTMVDFDIHNSKPSYHSKSELFGKVQLGKSSIFGTPLASQSQWRKVPAVTRSIVFSGGEDKCQVDPTVIWDPISVDPSNLHSGEPSSSSCQTSQVGIKPTYKEALPTGTIRTGPFQRRLGCRPRLSLNQADQVVFADQLVLLSVTACSF